MRMLLRDGFIYSPQSVIFVNSQKLKSFDNSTIRDETDIEGGFYEVITRFRSCCMCNLRHTRLLKILLSKLLPIFVEQELESVHSKSPQRKTLLKHKSWT